MSKPAQISNDAPVDARPLAKPPSGISGANIQPLTRGMQCDAQRAQPEQRGLCAASFKKVASRRLSACKRAQRLWFATHLFELRVCRLSASFRGIRLSRRGRRVCGGFSFLQQARLRRPIFPASAPYGLAPAQHADAAGMCRGGVPRPFCFCAGVVGSYPSGLSSAVFFDLLRALHAKKQ